jgi:hypothetical protein
MDDKAEALEQFAAGLHELAQGALEHMGYNSCPPILSVIPESPDRAPMIGPVEIETGRAYATVQANVLHLGYPVKVVALSSDTYMLKVESTDPSDPEFIEATSNHRVPLAKRFAEGDPLVTEALSTIVMMSGRSISLNQPYKWTPVDGWEWGEITKIETSDWDFDRLVSGQPRLDINGYPICPRCGNHIPDDLHPGEHPGATSRSNNITEVCSACGVDEALSGMMRK